MRNSTVGPDKTTIYNTRGPFYCHGQRFLSKYFSGHTESVLRLRCDRHQTVLLCFFWGTHPLFLHEQQDRKRRLALLWCWTGGLSIIILQAGHCDNIHVRQDIGQDAGAAHRLRTPPAWPHESLLTHELLTIRLSGKKRFN